jgi:hypothetical protein
MRIAPIVLVVFAVAAAACGPQESGRKQHLEFEAFTVDEGVYQPKPGWTFTKGEKNTIVAARQNSPGVVITPCACSLETGGSCDQAELRDPQTGDILEVWCVDNGCGFCVGGTAQPDNPFSAVRFNVVCIADRKASKR